MTVTRLILRDALSPHPEERFSRVSKGEAKGLLRMSFVTVGSKR